MAATRRGQLSFENLALSLVAIVLIMISITALVSIKENAGATFGMVTFKASAARIEAAANEVCILGNGNSRIIFLESPLALKGVEGGAIALYKNYSTPLGTRCQIVDSELLEGKTEIKNEKGRIMAK